MIVGFIKHSREGIEKMDRFWTCDYQDSLDRTAGMVTLGDRGYDPQSLTDEQKEAQRKAYDEAVRNAQ